MLSDEAKQSLTTTLDTAQSLLTQGASYGASLRSVPAETQEAAQILASVERVLPQLQQLDQLFYRDTFNRIEKMWATYLRSTNLCGLADVADLALRYL